MYITQISKQMKKTYICPDTLVLQIHIEHPLAGSSWSEKGIGYGGVDDDGEYEPETKQDYFDFEWE